MSYQIYDIGQMIESLKSHRYRFDNYVFSDPTAAQQALKQFMMDTEQILNKMKDVLSRQDSDICKLMADVPPQPNDHYPSWIVTPIPFPGSGYAKPQTQQKSDDDIPF